MKLKKGVKLFLCVVAVIGILAGCTYLFNWYRIDIKLAGDKEVVSEFGEEYVDEGARVRKVAILFPLFGKEYDYKVDNGVDVNNIGKYEYKYYADFNGKHYEAVRNVEIKDTVGPVITLVSDPDGYTLPNHSYEEEGFSAIDKHDGDVTDKVVRTDNGDNIVYQVTDSFGNSTEVVRTVVFDDRNAPVITFDDYNFVQIGTSFDNEYKAIDDADGDVTDKVQVEGTVDVNTAGEYTLKYSVSDAYGNKAETERVVKVFDYDPDKVIFMTFDDGPGPYTDRLLDILAKYNIKVTFFVTHVYSNYEDCIKREYEEGHAIGVHSYTHNYATVYQSTDAYWDDFNKMNDVIERQTGHRSKIFRFPGGSSNTVSFNYCDGVMSALAAQSRSKGLTYFDWNVESGDAGRTTDPDEVVENLKNGVYWHSVSVALSHDSLEYTVEGIEEFFKWALENGYTFMTLDENSPTAHHGIAN